MSAHRWTMPARKRMNVAASANNRRSAAAVGWARDTGVVADGHSGVDWHRLRSGGLCD